MNPVRFAIVYIVLVIVLAHGFAPVEYMWMDNTISELASQGVPHQWIMQIGFIGFGLILATGLIIKGVRAKRLFWPDIFLSLYGLSILAAGFFSEAPYIAGMAGDAREAALHSTFASAAGILLTIGIVVSAAVVKDPQDRWRHLGAALLVSLVSASFGLAESGQIPLGKGLLQRVLWLVSFAWLWWSQRRRSIGDTKQTAPATS